MILKYIVSNFSCYFDILGHTVFIIFMLFFKSDFYSETPSESVGTVYV